MPDLRVNFPQPCDEPWDAMTKTAGCDRVCGRCDRIIHDLSHYDIDEAEALLRANPRTCVRAEIGADGTIALKPGGGKARRMVIAAAATAGLLATSMPAQARQERPGGAIVGEILDGSRTRITATAADGRVYRTRIRSNGRFRIKHLPPGTYTVSYSDCGTSRTLEVVVREGEVRMERPPDEDRCIVIGQLRIEEQRG